MASLFWSKNTLVCTSESSFVVLSQRQSDQLLHRETRRKPGELFVSTTKSKTGSSTGQTKPTEEPSEELGSHDSDPSHTPIGRILACRFSPSGQYFALCDDYKTLSLYDTEGFDLLSTRSTQKRCMAVAFNHAEDTVYVADKFGDVYSYSVTEPEDEGNLNLGHLSMLLDVVVSPDDKYILTSDRDEKIRISCLQNAYNIHGFCLGHTEFVSRIAIVPGFESILITGGGDSTLRFWDYRQGKQLQCLSLSPPAEVGGEGQQQIVTGITCCRRHGLVAVTVLGSSCVSLFHATSSASGNLQVARLPPIRAQAVCWSACFDHQDRLWVLRQLESQPVVVFSVDESSDCVSLQPLDSSADNANMVGIVKHLNSDWNFFDNAVNTPSPYASLYKRSFDNTKAYLERKEQRIQEQQQKKHSKKKDGAMPAGKRARLDADKKTLESDS